MMRDTMFIRSQGFEMSTAAYFSVFEASDTLAELHAQFARNIAMGTRESQAPLLYQVLSLFLEECLDAFFLAPVEKFRLNGVGKKIVLGGVAAINKTVDFALKRIIFKLENGDLESISAHIESLIQRPADESEPVWVAVPLSADLHHRLTGAIATGRSNGGSTVEAQFTAALCDLVDVSLNYYFEIPIKSLKMGFMMEKMAWVANDTVKSGAKTVIRKVTPTMSDKEMEFFFQFAESLVRPGRI